MRFLKANTLFNGTEALSGDLVLVLDDQNRFKELVPESQVEVGNIERFEGIITPGFVNAHCHLELSHLKGQIPQHTGLPGFARQVITRRQAFSKEEIVGHMQAADTAMHQNGIVAVGDISNGVDSFKTKVNSPVFYHTFIELIGLNPANRTLIFEKGLDLLQQLQQRGLRGSLSPHAPYSASVELIGQIAAHNTTTGLPLTIHNQESEEETKFFKGMANGFDELYKFLGLDTSWYKAPGTSSLQAYAAALPETVPSLLVHNTFTSREDVEATRTKTSYWCFCPGANLYIENRLADFSVFAEHQKSFCIGTDSLASNTQLDVTAEVNHILKATTVFPQHSLLRAITSNGAAALGLADRFGSFIPGKNAGLNLVDLSHSQLRFLKKIT